MGNAVAVTDETFTTEVLNSTEPVLVDFWAAWCGPCRVIAPTVEELAIEYKGRLKVVKVDVDQNQDIAVRYGVQSIPTLMVFKGGKMVERVLGALPKPRLVTMIQPHLAKAVPAGPIPSARAPDPGCWRGGPPRAATPACA